MKVTILTDMARFGDSPATFDFDTDGNPSFGNSIESDIAYKFLIIDNSELVIGAIEDHAWLYAVYSTLGMSAEEAAEKMPGLVKTQYKKHNPVTGAGTVGCTGKVLKWSSIWFSVTTPADQRSEIQAEIARLHESGALMPR